MEEGIVVLLIFAVSGLILGIVAGILLDKKKDKDNHNDDDILGI